MKWSTATATLTGVITAAAALLKIDASPAAVIRWHDVRESFTRRAHLQAGDPGLDGAEETRGARPGGRPDQEGARRRSREGLRQCLRRRRRPRRDRRVGSRSARRRDGREVRYEVEDPTDAVRGPQTMGT